MPLNSKIDSLIILTASVEISDQMGLSGPVVLGVFDDMIEMGRAMGAAGAFYNRQRVAFKQTEVILNQMPKLREVTR